MKYWGYVFYAIGIIIGTNLGDMPKEQFSWAVPLMAALISIGVCMIADREEG